MGYKNVAHAQYGARLASLVALQCKQPVKISGVEEFHGKSRIRARLCAVFYLQLERTCGGVSVRDIFNRPAVFARYVRIEPFAVAECPYVLRLARSCVKPAAVKLFLRLARACVVPLSVYVYLDPCVVVLAMRPLYGVDLPRRYAYGAIRKHRKCRLLSTPAVTPVKYGKHVRSWRIVESVRDVCHAVVVNLYRRGHGIHTRKHGHELRIKQLCTGHYGLVIYMHRQNEA